MERGSFQSPRSVFGFVISDDSPPHSPLKEKGSTLAKAFLCCGYVDIQKAKAPP